MRHISIIGFGRFGKTLYRLMKDDYIVTLHDRGKIDSHKIELTKNTTISKDLNQVYKNSVIFYAVPISAFKAVIASHKKYFQPNQLLIDVLSVKLYPAKVLIKYLKKSKTQALLTHPMFGPDSSQNGFSGLQIVMNKFMADDQNYNYWKNYFIRKGLRVIEMSAREHDKLAAESQGVTHFIGRLLEEFKFKPTNIDALGSKKLYEIMDQTCNDTWELFLNLQNFNPFTKKMRLRLGHSYDKLYNRLLPINVSSKYIIYGIQGGIGSFSEEAVLFYLNNKKVNNFKIKYLYTTENVLKSLHRGNIDFGLFAIQNAVGGVVQESTYAMARYKFKILDEFVIKIKHFLMKRKDVDITHIRNILAHPQVFKQCQSTLAREYRGFKLISGKGNMIDTALAAEALSKNKIPKNTAILGPGNLAPKYNFDIIGENLQDDKENLTTFFLVKR